MAAGKGTRLKSKHPKVLHEIGGRPLLAHVIRAASGVVPPSDIYVIVGHEADRVRTAVASYGTNFVEQREQRGTGHAIMQTREAIQGYDHVIVLSGDVPAITTETIARIRDFHLQQRAAMTLLSAVPPDRFGYGRVIRAKKNGKATDLVVRSSNRNPPLPRNRRSARSIPAFTPSPFPNSSPASTSSAPTIPITSTT
jgi:bifunctional UDP-N-acetylglucosamine pyrophosphorylase / glucosamine-1-phosphate N-acetyltransferase